MTDEQRIALYVRLDEMQQRINDLLDRIRDLENINEQHMYASMGDDL